MDRTCVIYHINKDDKLIFISEEWQPFADANHASHLNCEHILHQPLSDFITGWECQELYTMLIDQARNSRTTLSFPFRCDAPDKRRFMQMNISLLANEVVEFHSCILHEEKREPIHLLNTTVARTKEILTVCSWCKKIKLGEEQWCEMEEAVRELDLFGKEQLPQLSHGVCRTCYDNVSKDWSR